MNAVHGLLLEVDDANELLAAASAARDHGLAPMDAFSPYPVENLVGALGISPSPTRWIMLACGVIGGLTAFGTMSYATIVGYPFNIGGRPYFSWPTFVPITFELSILFAALGGAVSLVLLSRLPRLHHPVFNDKRFRDSDQSGFFLLLPDSPAARSFLDSHYPDAWKEVEE